MVISCWPLLGPTGGAEYLEIDAINFNGALGFDVQDPTVLNPVFCSSGGFGDDDLVSFAADMGENLTIYGAANYHVFGHHLACEFLVGQLVKLIGIVLVGVF